MQNDEKAQKIQYHQKHNTSQQSLLKGSFIPKMDLENFEIIDLRD